jgi:hypothetical protein
MTSRLKDTDIKVLNGPYGHIWRNQYDIKEHADACYDIEMWGNNIIWAYDCRWIVPERDYQEWSRDFQEYKNSSPTTFTNVTSIIEKAIEAYNLKKNLNPETVKTLEDLINEL